MTADPRGRARDRRRRRPCRRSPRRRGRDARGAAARPTACMNASVGPFTTRPPTNGLTATTGAARRAIASRIPATREDRADRDHRVRRADDDRLGRRERGGDLGRRPRAPRCPRTRPPRSRPRRGRGSGTPAGRASRRAFGPGCGPARRTSAAPRRLAPSAARDLRLGLGLAAALGEKARAVAGRSRGRGRRAGTSPGAPSSTSRSKTVNASSRIPQPRCSSISPAASR